MRAVSEVLSTIIIAGTIIAVSLTVFYYSMLILNNSVVSTEFGHAKSLLVNIADNTNMFLQGNSYVATFPGKYVGIGYKTHRKTFYINITMPLQGNTVDYVDLIIKQGNSAETNYTGPNYYNVIIRFHLVDGEVVDVYFGLEDNLGITVPAPNIVENITYSNGTVVYIFGGIGTNVYLFPSYTLPLTFKLYPGDKFVIRMNDNHNDNNYGDGFYPLEITDYGLLSYDKCWEKGGYHHYTWIIINNTSLGKTFRTQALYKADGIEWPDYWFTIEDFSFNPDNSTYYYFLYHPDATVTNPIPKRGVFEQSTTVDRVYVKTIVLDQDIKSLMISATKPFITEYRVIYGVEENGTCPIIVNDPRYLPCIQGYFVNGKTYVELDYARLYKTIYILGSGTQNETYLIRLLYMQLDVVVHSTSPKQIVVIPSGNVYTHTYHNITDLDIIMYDNQTSKAVKDITLDDLIPNRNPLIPVDIVIIIRKINVVLT